MKKKKKHFGDETYKYVSQIFTEIKDMHRQDALQRGIKDTEQSWRSFKGKNLEKLIQYIIEDEVKSLGLEVVNGNKLDCEINDNEVLSFVKRNLLVDLCEIDTDSCYVLTDKSIRLSKNVKLFSDFINDLKKLKF